MLYRKYRIVRKVQETNLVVSLYLQPADGGQLAQYSAGQHLMFRLGIPGQEVPATRHYSFSDQFNKDYYRISVKKEMPPADHPEVPGGLCSAYLCDETKLGDLLEAKGPLGDFFLDPAGKRPVVLIAGGIGITPLLSMLKTVAAVNPKRTVYFFYGINERSDYAFEAELTHLRHNYPDFRFCIFCAKTNGADRRFDFEGLIDIERILEYTSGTQADYYICGPGGMMKYLTEALEKAGVAVPLIHTESFSSDASNRFTATERLARSQNDSKQTDGFMIDFAKSGRNVKWDNRYRSILEFAEANDIEISSGCLFGDCGTCLTTICEGHVTYTHATAVKPEKGKCLPCSCIPTSDLVLQA